MYCLHFNIIWYENNSITLKTSLLVLRVMRNKTRAKTQNFTHTGSQSLRTRLPPYEALPDPLSWAPALLPPD